MIESLLRRVSKIVFLYHKTIVVAFVILTIICVFIAITMEVRTEIIDVLPRKSKTVAQFKDFLQKYSSVDNISIVVESPTNAIEDHTDLIETIAERLKTSSLFEYVDYSALQGRSDFFLKYFPLFLDEKGLKQLSERLSQEGIERQVRLNRQRLLSPLSSPVDSELIARDPLHISSIVKDSMKRTFQDGGLDLTSGYYFTRDHSAAFIFAKPRGTSRDMAFVKKLTRELDRIIAAALAEAGNHHDVRVDLTGGYIFAEEARRAILRDILISSFLSILSICILIWTVYRVRSLLLWIIGFTMLASLSITLSFAYFAFGSLNIVTSIVTAVLIGLYVDYSMHLMKRYCDELHATGDRQRALETTLVKTGSAIVMSALTTSLSFFSIVLTDFEGLYELGIVAGAGVLFCLFTNLLLMNSLLLWYSKGGVKSLFRGMGTSPLIDGLVKLVIKWPRLILIFGCVLMAISGIGIFHLHFDNNPEHVGLRNSRALSTLRSIHKKMDKPVNPLTIVVREPDARRLTAAFDSLEKLLIAWRQERVIGRYESPSVFLPAPYLQETRLKTLRDMNTHSLRDDRIERDLIHVMEDNGLMYDEHHLRTYVRGITAAMGLREPLGFEELSSVSDPRLKFFYNRDDISFVVYLYPAGEEWDVSSLRTIRQAVGTAGAGWAVIGKPIIYGEIKSSIIWGSVLATLAALLLNLVAVRLFFERTFHVILVMMPISVGFIMTFGIMGLLNAPFNFINIGAIA